MFIPLSETDTEFRSGGEERNTFHFFKRSNIPVQIKITRLPPNFNADLNWHRHQFVEEFSVPLIGEIIVKEDVNGKISEKVSSKALLKPGEWVVGIECESTKRATVLLEGKDGKRREVVVEFLPEFTEGKNWHTVGNPTNKMVTMLTLKRIPRAVLKKDPMALDLDREKRN